MNIDTGEIRKMADLSSIERGSGFWERIPEELHEEAQTSIDEEKPVDLNGDSGLAKFAQKKRRFRDLKKELKAKR